MNSFLSVLMESPEFETTSSSLERGMPSQVVLGLTGSMKSYVLAALYRSCPVRPFIVVTYSPQQAEKLSGDLATLLSPGEVLTFPALELWPHEEAAENAELIAQRIAVEARLVRGRRALVVVTARAFARKLVPARVFSEFAFALKPGERHDRDRLASRLASMGYERAELVERRGQFATRGDILDVFPPDSASPLRIEFFDDEIDSIREFDLESQRSNQGVTHAVVAPAREFLISPDVREAGLARLEAQVSSQRRRLEGLGRVEEARALGVRADTALEKFREQLYFDGDHQYAPAFYDGLGTIIDYAADPLVVVDEPARLKEAFLGFETEVREAYSTLLETGRVLPTEASLFCSSEEAMACLHRRQRVEFVLLARGVDLTHTDRVRSFSGKPASPYHGKFDLLVRDLKAWRRKNHRVVVVVTTEDRARRFREVMSENGIEVTYVQSIAEEVKPGNVVVTVGSLESGFEFPSLRLVVLTDVELYGAEKHRRRLSQPAQTPGSRLAAFTELRPGDYVVHVAHGIGRYMGVKTLEAAGAKRDYLLIQYAGEDKLYVPTDQIGLLQKYVGPEESPPRLYKLGGTEWSKVKARVKESVRDMARGLLELYAAREAIQGHAFSADTPWQREFEDAFPYEETPDQLNAVAEVKADMERPRPMDRLLCGDVGYGKTEVAIRAAFKAVMDSKQVAVLVPTTILAQQHFTTFKDRFAGYPVKIAALSRFQSESEQREILRDLRRGSLDIVIGTHRLLQPDVKFKDLGLVVVDEEQRFGVAHKEFLKELRKTVDVLTLTATPIPRTLHMALTGVRDMSIIETPPEDRFPVRTYVMEHDDAVIREAIVRELARGGQVYYVHNRVQTIDSVAVFLSRLVPEARIAVAHGQMPEDRLEEVMLRFLDHEYDVLVATTIIENGLDIANVNTLIVTDADTLGLAQLYQLRGRVGRSNRVAYAYFMYHRNGVLSEVAEKRLSAIKEFTDFGSGFKIAMRDLEIRGAGNLLGAEQHGHIAAVGFELYSRLVEEAVRELRGRPAKEEKAEPVIDLGVSAFIGEDYLADPRLKIEMYKKINAARTVEDIRDLEEEIEDRFGPAPEPCRNLLTIARIRAISREMGVAQVASERDQVVVKLLPGAKVSQDQVMEAVRANRGRVYANFGKSPSLRIRRSGLSDGDLLRVIEDTLHLVQARSPEAWEARRQYDQGKRGLSGGGKLGGRATSIG
ncbi:MAG: transcription-repair coupling factor [Firmicutes bacterium]|nr:transcription-repair coupling factor [Bacillota bacterium]MDH7496346.1 transcription-repair coupling factor [Bacillota bacterium]